MTIKEYETEIALLMERYRNELEALQERYKKEYSLYKVGDYCRDTKGFKCHFVVTGVRHLTNKGEIYTLIDGVTTNRHGEEHKGSRKDTFRDTEIRLLRPA
jgi:hypothetical protein